jgi:6-phosphogluconolactonase
MHLTRTISHEFKKIADKCIKEQGQCFIALSGGSTPQIYLERLSIVFANWQKVHIFWSDERCVPPGNAESNYNMIKENFLQLVDIPSINIHRIRGEDEPDEAGDILRRYWIGSPCLTDSLF